MSRANAKLLRGNYISMEKKYNIMGRSRRHIALARLIIHNSSLITVFFALFTSCVEPLKLTPDIVGNILSLEVEGQTRPSNVSTAARTINIELGEGSDLSAVKVVEIVLVETARCEITAGSTLDLSSPLRVRVTTAADYEWTITATNKFDPHRPLPGGDFEQWHRADRGGTVNPDGKIWNPWRAGAVLGHDRWWDTGNYGVTLLSTSNSIATDPGEGSPANPSGRAAKLVSILAGGIKAAGGNIYFGKFGGLTTDLNATCDIGHPWQTKPRALKGWYKYFPQPIDAAIDDYVDIHPFELTKDQWLGSMDSLHVNIALWADPEGRNIPFTVNTSPGAFLDFSLYEEYVTDGLIAYGSMVSGDEQAEWGEFTLLLEYLKEGPLPENTQLFLQITSSKNCNYFIAGTSGGGPDGKTGSEMYVDELELVY